MTIQRGARHRLYHSHRWQSSRGHALCRTLCFARLVGSLLLDHCLHNVHSNQGTVYFGLAQFHLVHYNCVQLMVLWVQVEEPEDTSRLTVVTTHQPTSSQESRGAPATTGGNSPSMPISNGNSAANLCGQGHPLSSSHSASISSSHQQPRPSFSDSSSFASVKDSFQRAITGM